MMQNIPARVQQPSDSDEAVRMQALVCAQGQYSAESHLPQPKAASTQIGGAGPADHYRHDLLARRFFDQRSQQNKH